MFFGIFLEKSFFKAAFVIWNTANSKIGSPLKHSHSLNKQKSWKMTLTTNSEKKNFWKHANRIFKMFFIHFSGCFFVGLNFKGNFKQILLTSIKWRTKIFYMCPKWILLYIWLLCSFSISILSALVLLVSKVNWNSDYL